MWPLQALQPLQKEHISNHLSVYQRIRSAIRDSQQPASPLGVSYSETSATALGGTTGMMRVV